VTEIICINIVCSVTLLSSKYDFLCYCTANPRPFRKRFSHFLSDNLSLCLAAALDLVVSSSRAASKATSADPTWYIERHRGSHSVYGS